MKLAKRYVLSLFFPVCLLSLLFFITMLELADVFAYLFKYLSNEVSLKNIAVIAYYHLPKCLVFSLPIAILFATSYSLGNLYSSFELTAFFSSGFSLLQLVIPLLVFGLILSFGIFQIEDKIASNFSLKKNEIQSELINEEKATNNSNLVLISNAGKIIYTASYYQDKVFKLYDPLVIVRDDSFNITKMVSSKTASWSESFWVFDNPIVYSFENDTMHIDSKYEELLFNEKPDSFKKNLTSVEELPYKKAKDFIQSLQNAGIETNEHLANYYKRFSFPLTVFVVLFFSISLGGRFKKNILLMSLLISFSLAVLFYITQMIFMLFAKWAYVSPFIGAWFPVLLYIVIGAILLYFART